MTKLYGNTKCGCAYCKKWSKRQEAPVNVLSKKEKKILGIGGKK